MVIVLMGVAGVGKTTIGRHLAHELGWRFVDGDDFHPPTNIGKLRNGIPLTDSERAPWLVCLRRMIADWIATKESVVLACSALKKDHRRTLLDGYETSVSLVYLKGSYGLVRRRLETRRDHFMSTRLLDSQFETLEEPTNAIVVETDIPVESIVHSIRTRLNL